MVMSMKEISMKVNLQDMEFTNSTVLRLYMKGTSKKD